MKTTSSEHVVYINCSECQNKKQFVARNWVKYLPESGGGAPPDFPRR